MSQIERKWIEDQAINNQKIDPSDIYTITGLRVDETNAIGRIGVGLSDPLDALHIRRTDSSAGLMLDLNDSTDGQLYKIYSGSNGLLNFTDATDGGVFNYSAPSSIGRIGINTTTVEDHVHIVSPSINTTLRLDLNDGVNGRAYRLVSDSDGAFKIIDVDGGSANRFQIANNGTLTYPGDATFGSNFQIDGTITVVNTEVVVADQLEINQTDNQTALIVSQDTPGTTATVMKIENAGTGHALTTDNGRVGIGTASPVSQLHLYDTSPILLNSGTSGDYYSYSCFYNFTGGLRVGKETTAGGTIFTDTGASMGCIGTDSNNGLQFVTNDTVKVTLSNTGNLGIGTNNPGPNLHIYSTDTEKARIETSNDIANTQQLVTFYNNNTYYSFISAGKDSSNNPFIAMGTVGGGSLYVNDLACVGIGTIPTEAKLQVSKYSSSVPDLRLGTSATGSLSFHSYQSGHFYNEIISGNNEHLVLTTSGTGNVGIGTTNPTSKLHLVENGVVGTTLSNTLSGTAGSLATYSSDFRILSSVHLTLGSNGVVAVQIQNSNQDFTPYSDNTIACGRLNRRWTAVYAVNGTIQTSDKYAKKNIADSDLGLDFITKLRPVSYQLKEEETDKKRYGLIAQEINEVISEDLFAGTHYNKELGRYALTYTEFIAPLIKAIQEQQEIIKELKNRLIKLEKKLTL